MGNIDLSKGGYVVLPVAEYNELISKVLSASNAVKVKRWKFKDKDQLEIIIDPDWLHAAAERQARMLPDFDEYDVKPVDEMYVSSITLAVRKAAPPEQEESTVEE